MSPDPAQILRDKHQELEDKEAPALKRLDEGFERAERAVSEMKRTREASRSFRIPTHTPKPR